MGTTRQLPVVAAFDCDGTLIRGDATRLFLWQLRGPLGCLQDLVRIAPTLVRWQLGSVSTAAFKERLLARAMAASSPQRLQEVLRHGIPAALIRRLRPEALRRLEWHRGCGHRLVIVTASPRFLIQPLADHLGIDLLATETSDPHAFTADRPFLLTSPNCKGAEKVERLGEWLAQPLSSIRLHAYGDTRGDRELLGAAAEPHWRSFSAERVPYPGMGPALPWTSLMGTLLLALALLGLLHLPGPDRLQLLQAIASLPAWLPALYGVLLASFTLRYWRWRVLLGSLSIGRWSRADALHWFRGFSLTATPGKLGELSRVQALHQALGYPRTPLVHVFVGERIADVVGVLTLLLLLAPSQLLARLGHPGGMVRWTGVAALTALTATFLVVGFREKLTAGWRKWRHHLPERQLTRALLPASGVSLLVWSVEPMLLFLLCHILSPGTISAPVAITTYLLSGTAGMASTLPGGIGVNEAATVVLLSQQGIPVATALPIAILRRMITPWSVVALAALTNSATAERRPHRS